MIEEIGEKVVEKIFLDLISEFSVDDLEYAVKHGIYLLDLAQENNSKLLSVGSNLARMFRGQSNLLTTENVLMWLCEKRKDMFGAIAVDRNKYIWLDRNVNEIKTFLFDM